MRFVWAVVAFVLAAVMIAAGIAQRTVFQGPTSQTTTIEGAGETPYLLIDGAVLGRQPGSQTLRAAADGEIFAAYGRTVDMRAWLSDTSYTAVTLDDDGTVVTTTVDPADDEGTGHDMTTSDLWLDQFQQDDILIRPLQLPAGMSVLVATDGKAPAPSEVSITWPISAATPWAGPLIVGGAILMLVGVVLYILGIRHVRRSRGPRRKAPPPLPDTEQIDLGQIEAGQEELSVTAADKGVISSGAPTRRSRRRPMVAVPVLLASSLVFAGCSADAWPQLASSPTPTPTETILDSGDQQPAVTASQADRILSRISSVVAEADKKKDPKLAATRLTGAPLAERKTNYTLRSKIKKQPAIPDVPAAGLKVVLPQSYEGWPRTVMLVAEQKGEKDVSSTIMMITQKDAWAPYKLSYIGDLLATQMPDVAPVYVGASAVQPDSSFLVMAPGEIAAAYADVIDHGSKSEHAGSFAIDDDPFLASIQKKRKDQVATFNKTAKKTGKLTFSAAAGDETPKALATLESGAIVAVNVEETEKVTPTKSDAVIKTTGNERVKVLTGESESATGFTTTYSDQLFFYVPGVGNDGDRIRLLGYSSHILGAKVVKKK